MKTDLLGREIKEGDLLAICEGSSLFITRVRRSMSSENYVGYNLNIAKQQKTICYRSMYHNRRGNLVKNSGYIISPERCKRSLIVNDEFRDYKIVDLAKPQQNESEI